MESLNELKAKVKKGRKRTVSVVNAADKEVLLAVKKALEEDLCTFLLFGDESKITELATDIGLIPSQWNSDMTIRHVENNHEAAKQAVLSINDKASDILMKGKITTKDILKAVLNKAYGLRAGKVLSHVALFEIPNQQKVVFLTDAAMNIAPDLQQKVEIIQNAVQVASAVGINVPKVAAITPVEVVNEAMQSTMDAAVLTQMQQRGQIKGCLIDGPLAFDNAVSYQAAQQKGIKSEVAGNADILLAPSIEAGNALYKSFVYYANAKVAAIISGAKAPIILTSRADSAESKVYSLSLALVSAHTF
ncbi:phosphate butyryltransferase [Virgibacillus salarius]|uniref:phosphate butyryltransferase n=1 Tax=Virgibacillus salarius TaxID=447199 RepID=UPI0031E36142